MQRRLLTGLAPVLVFLAVFGLGPTTLNFIESFRNPEGAFGPEQYVRIFTDAYYLTIIGQTLLFGLGVTMVCAVVGYPMAFAFARSTGRAKVVLLFVVVTPLLINVVVRSFGWMVILGPAGAINSALRGLGFGRVELMYNWFGVTVAMAHVLLPFMIISIAGGIELIDRRLEEAAGMLGASPAARFWNVTFPLSIDGLVTGCILCFTLAIGSFVTVMLLGDEGTMVMPMLIYQQLTVGADWAFAAAMGMVLLAVVLGVLWLQAQLQRRRATR
jgi:putative spermidine/putrescine transport system permease protein